MPDEASSKSASFLIGFGKGAEQTEGLGRCLVSLWLPQVQVPEERRELAN